VIVRSSQPELGWLGWRNAEDEALIRAIPEACAQDRGLLNLDLLEELGDEIGE
jgi:myotubularin-related protein 3/4